MKLAAHPNFVPPIKSSSSGIRPSRAPLRLPLIFQWRGRWYDGNTRDLGVGGTFIEAEEAPVQGSTIELVLDIDGSRRPLHISAIVRWHECGGFGVQFLQMGTHATHALALILGEA